MKNPSGRKADSQRCPKCGRNDYVSSNGTNQISSTSWKTYYNCGRCEEPFSTINDESKKSKPDYSYKPDLWWELPTATASATEKDDDNNTGMSRRELEKERIFKSLNGCDWDGLP